MHRTKFVKPALKENLRREGISGVSCRDRVSDVIDELFGSLELTTFQSLLQILRVI